MRQADTAQLALAGTSTIHSAEAITLRDMLVAAGTMENGGVKGLAWRASTVLQAERWLCAQCDVAFDHSVPFCPKCEVASASVRLVANNDLLARSLEVANSCSYGRQLRFLQYRQQHEGIVPSLGRFDDDDYDDLVEQSVDDLGASVRPSDRRDYYARGGASLPCVHPNLHERQVWLRHQGAGRGLCQLRQRARRPPCFRNS